MADDTRTALLKLRLQVIRADANDSIKTVQRMGGALQDIKDIEKGVNKEGVAMASAIVRTEKDAEKQALKLAKAFGFQADELKRAGKEAKGTGFLSGDLKGQLGTIRTENRAESFATRTVANVLPGDIGRTASEVFDLIDTIPDLGTAFSVLKASILDTLGALGGGSALAGGGIVLAFAALAGVIALIKQSSDEARDAVRKQAEAQFEYNKLIVGATQESIDKQLEANRLKVEEAELNLSAAQAARDAAYDAYLASTDIFDTSNLYEAFSERDKILNESLEATNKAKQEEINLLNARKDQAVITRSLLALEDERIDANIRTIQEAQRMTGEQATERLKAIKLEIDTLKQFTASDQTEAHREELQKRIDALTEEYNLLSILNPILIAHNDALAYEAKQRTDTIAAVTKYNDDISKINEQSRDAQTAAHEKYADALIQIAERAADAAENALRKLQEKRADLALGLSRDFEDAEIQRQRDQIDAQIKFADEEAKAARQHANDLKRIRLEGQRDERQAIQDRDAVALDAAQTKTREALQDANQDYADQKRERQIAFANELRDQQTQYARERQDTLTKYNRDLQDAQTQYNREIALAEQNRVQALQKAAIAYAQEQAQLSQKHAQELAKRQAAITAELALVTMGYAQRMRVQAMYENALVAQATTILSKLTSLGASSNSSVDTSHVIPFARGGNAPANRNLLVGERGPELVRFNKSARIYSASQTRGRGGGSNSLTLSLQGAQAKTIEVQSRQHAEAVFGVLLDDMGVN